MACATLKSVKIDFTEPAIRPADGYIVKYRAVGASSYSTLSPNPKASPIVIPSIAACTNIEGTITATADGVLGDPVAFVVAAAAGTSCSYYTVTEPVGSSATSSFRYVPCGQTAAVTLTLTDEHTITSGICCEDSIGLVKVFGEASVTKEGPCVTSNIVKTTF